MLQLLFKSIFPLPLIKFLKGSRSYALKIRILDKTGDCAVRNVLKMLFNILHYSLPRNNCAKK